jgi:AcrR family transcriptional regulator
VTAARRGDSPFLRALEPGQGWDGGREAVAASQRGRILDAVTRAVGAKGYAEVTIGEVVKLAGVSRRTFYEQFQDKEECFLAAYETGTELLIGGILEAELDLPVDAGWRDRLRVGIESFLNGLASEPVLAATLIVGVSGAGPRAAQLRQEVYERYASEYRMLGRLAAHQEPAIAPPADPLLHALVGGMGELVQRHIVSEGAETLRDLTPALVEFATVVIEGRRGALGLRGQLKRGASRARSRAA